MNARTDLAILGQVDRSTPEETAKRQARMEAERIRSETLRAAKDAIRKHGVRSNAELLAFLQCIHAAIPTPIFDTLLKTTAESLLEFCTDLDGELNGMGLELQETQHG